MSEQAATMFLVTLDVEPAFEAEVDNWYDQEHIPLLLKVPGFRAAKRYHAVEGSPRYLAIYELDGPEALQGEAFSKAVDTPWTARLRPHYTAKRGVYRQVNPLHGWLPGASAGSAVGGLMVIRLDVAAEDEPDFNAWYDEEHLAALCAVPGVIGARRGVALEGEPKFAAVYELSAPDIQASEAWKRAIDTPWSARLRERFTTRWRNVYVPAPNAASPA